MESFQRRILKIINLDQVLAASKLGIDCICKLIDKTNIKTMFKMLADPKHLRSLLNFLRTSEPLALAEHTTPT